MFVRATYEVARKEFLQLLRTKRLLIFGFLAMVLLVLITLVVPHYVGAEDMARIFGGPDTAVSNGILALFLQQNPILFFLSGLVLLQLLALLLTGDAVSSEWQDRTLFLLLSKPVPRSAFVMGKFLGVVVGLGGFTVLLLTLDYLLLVALHGVPDGRSVLYFATSVGLVLLGMFAYAGVALFLSSVTRNAISGTLLSILSWFIILPTLAQLERILALIGDGLEGLLTANDSWSQYLSPGPSMRVAQQVLVAGPDTPVAGDVWRATLALVLHIVVWVGLSLAVVKRRDFE